MSTSELPPPPSLQPAQANLHIFVARHVAHRQTAHVKEARHTSQKHVTSCTLHAAPPCASATRPPAIIQQNSGNKKPERARGRQWREGSNSAHTPQNQKSHKHAIKLQAIVTKTRVQCARHPRRVTFRSSPPLPSRQILGTSTLQQSASVG